MGIILDVVIIAILLLSLFIGYKRGLINVIFNLCAFILAIVITWILYAPVTNLVINNTGLDESIKSVVIKNGVTEENSKETENDNAFVEKYVSRSVKNAKNNMVKSSADVIAEKTVAIIVAIGLFIVVRIALILLKFVINGVANLPIIKQFNEVGGLLYGAISGIFVIYLLLAICFLLMSVNNIEAVTNTINSSFVTKFLYNNNIILNIIFK